MARASQDVRLVQPTDFDILDEMSDGRRYTASLLADLLDHRARYMSNRIGHLDSYGLITRVRDSTMFEITPKGRAALDMQDDYSHQTAQEFAQQVNERAEEIGQGDCSGQISEGGGVDV
jgi:RIO-like serine/threonine protein kinase